MPRRECIRRGSGQIHIHPKAMAVLERLAEARGEVVTRQELFDSIWPGSEVTDDALTQCVVELRKAFGDCARHPEVIETIPKVGFRLIPAVSCAGDSRQERAGGSWLECVRSVRIPAPWQWIFAACLSLAVIFVFWPGSRDAAPVQPLLSLAVLPFSDLTGQQDQASLADGLSVELIDALSRHQGLKVPDWTASREFRNASADSRVIASRLGVAYLLIGSLRSNGDHLRVTARLKDASSGLPMWTGSFDWSPGSPSRIQEEMAAEILAALEDHLELDLG